MAEFLKVRFCASDQGTSDDIANLLRYSDHTFELVGDDSLFRETVALNQRFQKEAMPLRNGNQVTVG